MNTDESFSTVFTGGGVEGSATSTEGCPNLHHRKLKVLLQLLAKLLITVKLLACKLRRSGNCATGGITIFFSFLDTATTHNRLVSSSR